MKKKKKTALIEMGKDGSFSVYTLDIEATIIGEGATVAEAKSDFENSVAELLRFYQEDGEMIPDELQNVSFEYKYDLPSFFHHFNFLNITKFAQLAGINPSLMRQYKQGQYVSEKQVSKIQTEIHRIGRELMSINLF